MFCLPVAQRLQKCWCMYAPTELNWTGKKGPFLLLCLLLPKRSFRTQHVSCISSFCSMKLTSLSHERSQRASKGFTGACDFCSPRMSGSNVPPCLFKYALQQSRQTLDSPGSSVVSLRLTAGTHTEPVKCTLMILVVILSQQLCLKKGYRL